MRSQLARVVFASVLSSAGAYAEPLAVDHNAHGWYNYFGDHPIGDSKWGIHLEVQDRRHDVVTKWQQLLLRPAINYDFKPSLTLTAGYAYVHSYSYSRLSPPFRATNENRLWQQIQYRYKAGRASLSTRVRFEERFLGSSTPGQGFRYEDRLRIWEQVTVPISKKTYFTGYDEVWFYAKPYVSKSSFDQNRAYAALGYRVNSALRLEVGYMNQALRQRSGLVLESNDTLMVSIYSNAKFKRR